MFIRSQNLFLRPAWAEDWAAILDCVRDEAVARNLANVPWPYGEAEARWFASQPQDQHYPHFLITLPKGQGTDEADAIEPDAAEIVGCIALVESKGADGHIRAALGYWIGRAHWGRGYASEAGRALLGFAPVLGHHHLVASCFRDNPASARVLRKLGFRPTGEVAMLTSPARGEPAPAATFALDLQGYEDGGAGLDDADAMVARRAA